jgi:hypothetical protein
VGRTRSASVRSELGRSGVYRSLLSLPAVLALPPVRPLIHAPLALRPGTRQGRVVRQTAALSALRRMALVRNGLRRSSWELFS